MKQNSVANDTNYPVFFSFFLSKYYFILQHAFHGYILQLKKHRVILIYNNVPILFKWEFGVTIEHRRSEIRQKPVNPVCVKDQRGSASRSPL